MPPATVEEPVTGFDFARSNESYGNMVRRVALGFIGLSMGLWMLSLAQNQGVGLVNQALGFIPGVGDNLQSEGGMTVV